jgi:hypothetical protein
VDLLAELDALDAGVLLLVGLGDLDIDQSHLLLQLPHLLPQRRLLGLALLAVGALLGGDALELLSETADGALRSLEPDFALADCLLQFQAPALQLGRLGLAPLELAGQLIEAGEQALLLALEVANLLLELAHLQHLLALVEAGDAVGTHLHLELGNRPHLLLPLQLDLPAQAVQLVLGPGRLVCLLRELRARLVLRSLLGVDGDAFEVLELASLIAKVLPHLRLALALPLRSDEFVDGRSLPLSTRLSLLAWAHK